MKAEDKALMACRNYAHLSSVIRKLTREIEEELAKCPHCLAAHKAIQGRKTAKRSLAATKRFIGKIGKEAT